MWAQATAGGDNVFARLVKVGKKVLRRVLQKRELEQGSLEQTTAREVPKPTWTLRSHTVKVDESASRRLIGGLFPKQVLKTQAAEARKQAALRLIRDARKVPVFAFVGLSLGASLDHQSQKKGQTDDVLCSGIRDLFQQYGGKGSSVETGGQHFSLQSLQLGQLIGQGCNAAVFEAKPAHSEPAVDPKEEEEEEAAEASTVCSEVSADGPAESVESQSEAPSDGNSLKEDSLPSVSESTDDNEEDDDISIISEDGDECDTDESLDGWVLYRLSSVSTPAAGEICDDSDSDIFILAGDEEGLESLPDLEDLASEFSWSAVKGCPPASESADGVRVNCTHPDVDDPATCTAAASVNSSLYPEPPDRTGVTTDDPEPAPNIQEGGEEFPLAVKMMYNYSVESKADHIMSAMVKETIPSMSHLSEASNWGHSSVSVTKRLPPHPNIVAMYDVFVDQTPDLPEGGKLYPSALPPRLNKDGGYGRNATMFLVMKKYSMTLSDFILSHSVDMHTRCMLFAQLLEGVAHLSSHGMAHRDLKGNNILVDLSDGPDFPHLAISDFGSCLADPHYGLTLPYLTPDTDRGGNSALMAPEIKCAVPGPNSTLDYSKADLWAAGTLAYEIFGDGNPFYNGFDSRSYKEDDLPKLPGDTPELVVKLVEGMMKRNPAERPTPSVAATCLELFLWGPSELQSFTNRGLSHCNSLWRYKEICHWLERLTMETVCQRVFGGRASRLDLQMKSTFLSRISRKDVFGVVSFEG